MSSEATRQICGNCGAPNDPDAVICIVCGAVLSAYAQSQPAATTTTTTPPPATTTAAPSRPSSPATDWRSMFETKPGRTTSIPAPPTDLDLDYREEPPITTTTSTTTTSAPPPPRPNRTQPTTIAPSTTPPPVRAPEPANTRAETAPPKPAPARPAPWQRPRSDPRFNRRRPQTMVGIGVFLLLMGCVVSVILSAVGASDLAVGLAFLCLSPLGFIAIVAAIVISISRKEGRGG